jgi:tRNA(Ile)-lysidine synthase
MADMATLVQKFTRFISEENLFQADKRLLLAVSGGVDSVVLSALCKQAGIDFAIAHCNFQLRGTESDMDEEFVIRLARELDREIFVKRFDTKKYAVEKKVSIQVAARELRYAWFYTIMDGDCPQTIGKNSDPSVFSFTATAHHLEDNIETICMNFSKGTGIAGLRGILPKQGKIVHPLLFAKKEELKLFALENSLKWTEDSSNESDKYTRNIFRHQVIPLIEKIYPAFRDNLSDNISRFRDIESLYQESINRYKKGLLYQKNEETHIPVLKLKKSTALKTIVFEIITGYHFSPAQVQEFLHLMDSGSGKFIRSSTHRILKNRKWIIISPNQNKSSETILIQEGEKQTAFEKDRLELTLLPATAVKIQTDNFIAMLDAGKINFPLMLRKWKPGDYFYPLGMTKKKKLNRFFIDNKLSQTDKEKTWVIEMDKKIIWVVGRRIDNRFKISSGTKQVLILEIISAPEK